MKRLLIVLMSLGLAFGAFAQTKIRGQVPQVNRNGNGGGKQVIVVSPRPYYNPYYSPFYGYNRLGYSRFGYGYNPYLGFNEARVSEPTQLDLDIDRIKSDYGHEIAGVRHDKDMAKSERKQKIRDLKHEKSIAIISAKQDYYKTSGDRN